jgi:16S rRNA (uracil1498-N3)-methyltransferase
VVAAACLTLKGGRTDWLVEKATELGAHSLLPLITARSQAGTNKDKFKALATKAGQQKRQRSSTDDWEGSSGSGSSEFQASRLERLAIAATKQSLRAHGLQVQPATSLQALLPQLQAAPVSLVAMAGAPPVLQVLQEHWQHTTKQQQQQQQQQQQDSQPAQLPAAQQQQQRASTEQSVHRASPVNHPW